jgi:hypothetical protein
MKFIPETPLQFDLTEINNCFHKELPATIIIYESHLDYTSIGRGLDYETKLITAFAEIVERYHLWNQKADLISPVQENYSMLTPIKQVLPFGTTLDDRVVEWKLYETTSNNQKIYIHRPINPKKHATYFQHTSSGSAIHQSKELALKSATEELIERHLFSLFWYFESNIYCDQFINKEIEYSLSLGWQVLFYNIIDYESATICIMLNKNDARFPSNGIILGLSYGKGEASSSRAYSECLQALEGWLVSNKKLNKDLMYFLSGKGAPALLDKIERSLKSEPSNITKEILENNEIYSFDQDAIHNLIYCEAVIPDLFPFQVNCNEGKRVHQKYVSSTCDIPKFNPIG